MFYRPIQKTLKILWLPGRLGTSVGCGAANDQSAQVQLDVASPVNIEVKAVKIVIEAVSKTVRKIKLPYSEAALLAGLDAHGAHADELGLPSASETGV